MLVIDAFNEILSYLTLHISLFECVSLNDTANCNCCHDHTDLVFEKFIISTVLWKAVIQSITACGGNILETHTW